MIDLKPSAQMIYDVTGVEDNPWQPTKGKSCHNDDHVFGGREERGQFVLLVLRNDKITSFIRRHSRFFLIFNAGFPRGIYIVEEFRIHEYQNRQVRHKLFLIFPCFLIREQSKPRIARPPTMMATCIHTNCTVKLGNNNLGCNEEIKVCIYCSQLITLIHKP